MTEDVLHLAAQATYEAHPHSLFGPFWDELPESARAVWLRIVRTANVKVDGRDWINIRDALPKCNQSPGSFGVPVIVNGMFQGEGDREAFYGCRVTDTPAFYYSGAVLTGVRRWRPACTHQG